ncbi:MAG: bacterial proteasome activator family protein [Actinobacteria bacterium]|nr:bacterial proteasome activator family protein [Actinomycetota bacterium]
MSDASEHELLSPELVSPDGDTDVANDEAEEQEVESPAKLIRIGAMIKQLLDEVHNTSLDEPARQQLRDIYENSITELRSAMSSELSDELDRLTLDFSDDSVPTDAQLRIAKAQLVGWLEGLFHGIQASLMAQQIAARSQLEQMRGQLPTGGPGSVGPMGGPAVAGGPGYI